MSTFDDKLDEIVHKAYNRFEKPEDAKQAIKILIKEDLIGEDMKPLYNGYMPESHEAINMVLTLQREKLTGEKQ